jgi:ATP-binding protein involved in chromosome partitioning
MIDLPSIKNIIAIASGKGGVGKSTLAVNLALALVLENQQTGILDADLYGPSLPTMLDITEKPEEAESKIVPIEKYHLKTISIGYFLSADQPAIWRGPMVSKYLQELCQSTQWGNLDFLIIDLPPGTGDIQLTLSQKIRTTGAVIITTPQDVALIDAKKAIKMFEKVNVPVLGIVENMSTHICRQCGHEENIFGKNGAEKLGEKYHIELLGKLPLDKSIREDTDKGCPSVVSDPESKVSLLYRDIAKKIIQKTNFQLKLKSKLPGVQKI